MLGAGCWVLGAGCWVLGAGCWVFGWCCGLLGGLFAVLAGGDAHLGGEGAAEGGEGAVATVVGDLGQGGVGVHESLDGPIEAVVHEVAAEAQSGHGLEAFAEVAFRQIESRCDFNYVDAYGEAFVQQAVDLADNDVVAAGVVGLTEELGLLGGEGAQAGQQGGGFDDDLVGALFARFVGLVKALGDREGGLGKGLVEVYRAIGYRQQLGGVLGLEGDEEPANVSLIGIEVEVELVGGDEEGLAWLEAIDGSVDAERAAGAEIENEYLAVVGAALKGSLLEGFGVATQEGDDVVRTANIGSPAALEVVRGSFLRQFLESVLNFRRPAHIKPE